MNAKRLLILVFLLYLLAITNIAISTLYELDRTWQYSVTVPYTEWISSSSKTSHNTGVTASEWILKINFTGIRWNGTTSTPRFTIVICNYTSYSDNYISIRTFKTSMDIWQKTGTPQTQLYTTTRTFTNDTIYIVSMSSSGLLSVGTEDNQTEFLHDYSLPYGKNNAKSIGVISYTSFSNIAGNAYLYFDDALTPSGTSYDTTRTWFYDVSVPYTEWINSGSKTSHSIGTTASEWILKATFSGIRWNGTTSSQRFTIVVCNTTTYTDQYVGLRTFKTTIDLWEKVNASQQQLGSTVTRAFTNSTTYIISMTAGGLLNAGTEGNQTQFLNSYSLPYGAIAGVSIGVISLQSFSNIAGSVHLYIDNTLADEPEAPSGYITDSWRSYDNLTATFKTLCDNYDYGMFNASYEDLGLTEQNNHIWAYHFGNGTRVMNVAAVHGDEHENSQMWYNLAYWLCTSGTGQAIQILMSCEIVIVPVINVDHFKVTRKNENGVDLNRNFETGWGTQGSSDPANYQYWGTGALSENETQVLHEFIDSYQPEIFLDWHQFQFTMYGLSSTDQVNKRNELWDAASPYWTEDAVSSYPRSTSVGGGFIFREALAVGNANFSCLIETGAVADVLTAYSYGGSVWLRCKDVLVGVSDVWGGNFTIIPPPETPPTPPYSITLEVSGYIIYGTNFSMFFTSGETFGFCHDVDKWVLFSVNSGNLNSTITHTECTVRDGYLRFQAREATTISTSFSVDYVMVEGDMNATRHELGNGSTFQVYAYDTVTLNWGYQEKSLLDIYAHLGLGTAGILLLILSPSYVAWHIHKHSFDDETIGCIMIAMVGFFSGLGLFFMWVIT